jgi:lipoprotein-releasing system ATP-binding protein
MKKLIVAKNIHKKSGDLNILKNIAGTLSRPDKSSDVSIQINNTNILELKENELSEFRNQKLGFIFQFHELLPEFNALENVMIPAFIKGIDRKKAELRATKLLNQLGLKDRLNHKPNELSGGEQQRVAVARALMNNPKIIFADEPSGNLDSASAEQLHQLFFDLRDQFGHTFVIVTHNQELANKADRKIELVDGKILD